MSDFGQVRGQDRKLRGEFNGVYVGFVEYNKDPKHMGRLQVRVREIYGDDREDETPTHLLPWAKQLQFFGGFNDGGSHTPYPVGSTVLVSFEQGDKYRPIILGGIPKSTDLKPLTNLPESEDGQGKFRFLQKDSSNWKYGVDEESMGEWESDDSPAKTDIPEEVQQDREETKYVIFKTPKGNTIVIEEMDEAEDLKIIDRAGQVLQMFCPVTSPANQGNEERRVERNVEQTDGVPYSSIVGQKAYIRFIDLAKQEITLIAEEDKERILIKSQNRDLAGIQTLLFNTEKGNEYIKMTDKDGQYLEYHAAKKEINIEGHGDKNEDIADNHTQEIGANWTVNVGGNAYITCGGILRLRASTIFEN